MFTFKYSKNVTIIIIILIAIGIYFPQRHARYYSCENVKDILQELHEMNENSVQNICDYPGIFEAIDDAPTSGVTEQNYVAPVQGGEYKPRCTPLQRTAIIVPYRDRSEQLEIFLNYMHHFLQKQKLYYRIFVVDQNNTQLFNRAKLLNIGAEVAIKMEFQCLILHDIDLIPLNFENFYICSKVPRHMSSSLDTFRYNLPYLTLFGGAVAILSEQYKVVNGMSNLFDGWGGEDDDFYRRLEKHGLIPYRFCPSVSTYTMLIHKKNRDKSENRHELLKDSTERIQVDGLNSLKDNYTIQLKRLYTRIVVV